jgi:hypothetical protein
MTEMFLQFIAVITGIVLATQNDRYSHVVRDLAICGHQLSSCDYSPPSNEVVCICSRKFTDSCLYFRKGTDDCEYYLEDDYQSRVQAIAALQWLLLSLVGVLTILMTYFFFVRSNKPTGSVAVAPSPGGAK